MTSCSTYPPCSSLTHSFIPQVTGIPSAVKAELYKVVSVNLCSNIGGQVLMAAVMNPPREGEHAFPQFNAERGAILTALASKAKVGP